MLAYRCCLHAFQALETGLIQSWTLALELVGDGIELHPKNAALLELLGDLLIRKGQTEQAASNFRTAYQLDPKLGKGATLEEYVASRMKVN